MTEQIFISYSKKDSDFAHKLADDLEAAGFKTWIDKSIGGGDLW
ncbi:MAG: toll/interleukin-1 receptor domain-containing protein [Anaerolineales bacterium]